MFRLENIYYNILLLLNFLSCQSYTPSYDSTKAEQYGAAKKIIYFLAFGEGKKLNIYD